MANVRVVQKNLVFVVGLPPRLADADVSFLLVFFFTKLEVVEELERKTTKKFWLGRTETRSITTIGP